MSENPADWVDREERDRLHSSMNALVEVLHLDYGLTHATAINVVNESSTLAFLAWDAGAATRSIAHTLMGAPS